MKPAHIEEGLPAGAKDMTHLIGNPTCDTEELDAWTFEHGGLTLAEDSTLMFYMKNFDVWQVIHGLPAGEYELRVKAWQLPKERDAALYDYEHAEDKEDGCAGTTAEIYAGPFSHRVKNCVSAAHIEDGDSSDVRLRFVCLDDSVDVNRLPHSDVVILPAFCKSDATPALKAFIANGGQVVLVADTEKEREAAPLIKGATVVSSYAEVIPAILK